MPGSDDVGATTTRRARRWPAVLVGILAAGSLVLTGALFARDRQNAAGSTASRANAGQDALALATLHSLARSLRLDAGLRAAGASWLLAADVHVVETRIVAPLGGTLERQRHQWTLALAGGFACLTWQPGPAWGAATTARGVCSDNTPLVLAPPVSAARFSLAVHGAARAERAAANAAAESVLSTEPTAARGSVLATHVTRRW